MAHAVDDDPAGFRRRADDNAAGTHAEGICGPTSGPIMIHQSIVGRPQSRMTRRGPVLGPVDQFLGMFDAHADRKRFCFHRRPAMQQRLISVPGAMADSEQDGRAGQLFAPIDGQSDESSLFHLKIRHLLPETHLAAQHFDLPADVPDHLPQAVGADMRFVPIANFRWRSRFHHNIQRLGHQPVMHPGCQFPVGKGPGAPFAKLHIGRFIEDALFPKLSDCQLPRFHVRSPFQH